MSKLIAFSGGCHSGKTTSMGKLKKYLEKAGYSVVVLDELVRTATNIPIDELRKDPSSYLEFQDVVIRAKMRQENAALEVGNEIVVLADRAITDSLFYLQNYVDKSKLTDDEMILFCGLHNDIVNHATKMFETGYSIVLEFVPLHGINKDPYRPKHIDFSKQYEYEAIHLLNKSFSDSVITVDLNVSDFDDHIKNIIQSI